MPESAPIISVFTDQDMSMYIERFASGKREEKSLQETARIIFKHINRTCQIERTNNQSFNLQALVTRCIKAIEANGTKRIEAAVPYQQNYPISRGEMLCRIMDDAVVRIRNLRSNGDVKRKFADKFIKILRGHASAIRDKLPAAVMVLAVAFAGLWSITQTAAPHNPPPSA